MFNKKAEDLTTKNFLSIFLAVLCLLLLAYGVWKVYDYTSSNQEAKAAKALADMLQERINALEAEQSANITIRGINKAGDWYLTGWDLDNTDRPQKCFFEPCICVCKGKTSQDCQNNGFCRNIETEKIISGTACPPELVDVSQKNTPDIIDSLEQINERLIVRNSINLPNNLMRLELTKYAKEVRIIENIDQEGECYVEK